MVLLFGSIMLWLCLQVGCCFSLSIDTVSLSIGSYILRQRIADSSCIRALHSLLKLGRLGHVDIQTASRAITMWDCSTHFQLHKPPLQSEIGVHALGNRPWGSTVITAYCGRPNTSSTRVDEKDVLTAAGLSSSPAGSRIAILCKGSSRA